VRSKQDSSRPSAEVIDQFFEDCHQKPAPSTSSMSNRFFGLLHDTIHRPVPTPVACCESRLDDMEGPGQLLVDLDDQTVLCRRQSAAVIEQVFDSIDYTQQQRDPRARVNAATTSPNWSSVISVQYYCFQGSSLHKSVNDLTSSFL